MFLMEDQDDLFQTKQMMIILEEKYIGVIDQISQELDTRFDEVNMELLSCMAALNPSNLFASFDSNKVCRQCPLICFFSIPAHDLKCQLINLVIPTSYLGLLNFTLMIFQAMPFKDLKCNLITILMT